MQAIARRHGLLNRREAHGHIHYFTKETALESLRNVGYEVLERVYTPRCTERQGEDSEDGGLAAKNLLRPEPDSTVRPLSGYSLLVLARQELVLAKPLWLNPSAR